MVNGRTQPAGKPGRGGARNAMRSLANSSPFGLMLIFTPRVCPPGYMKERGHQRYAAKWASMGPGGFGRHPFGRTPRRLRWGPAPGPYCQTESVGIKAEPDEQCLDGVGCWARASWGCRPVLPPFSSPRAPPGLGSSYEDRTPPRSLRSKKIKTVAMRVPADSRRRRGDPGPGAGLVHGSCRRGDRSGPVSRVAGGGMARTPRSGLTP